MYKVELNEDEYKYLLTLIELWVQKHENTSMKNGVGMGINLLGKVKNAKKEGETK